MSSIIKSFLEKPRFGNFKLHALILVFLFMLSWHQFFVDIQNVMLLLVFFIVGVLSPVLVTRIKDCLQSDEKRLETIRSLIIILALPLTMGLLENVVSNTRDIEKNIGRVFERIDDLKRDSDGEDKIFYNKLLRIKEESTDPVERSIFESQIRSFQLNYLTTEDSVKNIPLCKPHVNCAQLETEQFETIDNIYSQRKHYLWVTRAKVAYLLRFTTNERIKKTNEVSDEKFDWEKIMISLVDRMAPDEKYLTVSKTALDSFRIFVPDFRSISPIPTKENPETVFDFDKAIEYWNINKVKIVGQLNKTKVF
jgi:hypothetical protein